MRIPPEINELFNHTDGEGLLEPNDLEEAGFKYQQEAGDLEIWEKNGVELEYHPEERAIESYKNPREF